MFRRWVAWASLCCLASQACGERAGDPIVALRSEATDEDAGAAGAAISGSASTGGTASQGGSGGAGGASEPLAGQGGASDLPPGTVGPSGLCAPCASSVTCGDSNDACINRDGTTFCGRDCAEGPGCPDGYSCVELGNSSVLQCVPNTSCAVTVAEPPPLAEIRAYVLSRINEERLSRDRGPLSGSSCLDELAQASAVSYAFTDERFGTFVEVCEPTWPDCSCGWRAEAELAISDYGLDWRGAVERALATDGFNDSLFDFGQTEVGIGFWISGDEAWIALSFA